MGQQATGEICDGRQDEEEQRQGTNGGPLQSLGLSKGPEAQENSQGRQQVGPDVDHFVVFLKEAEEVVAPFVARGAIAGVDVGFPEKLGHICLGHSAWHLGQPILQDLGQAAKLLPTHRQRAQALQNGSGHGCTLDDLSTRRKREQKCVNKGLKKDSEGGIGFMGGSSGVGSGWTVEQFLRSNLFKDGFRPRAHLTKGTF